MFNWFRRQFSGSEAEQQPSPQSSEEQTPEPAEPAAEEIEVEAESVREDYLSYAKAAFEKIQQRKLEQANAQTELFPTADSTVEPLPTETPSEVEASESKILRRETTEPASTSSEQVDEEPAAIKQTVATSETAVDREAAPRLEAEVQEPPAGVPAWLSKSNRLDVLKETVIESPAEAEPASEEEAQTDELSFDEEFIWSTQVLAAQGRRSEDISAEEITWLKRLRQGLGKTRRNLINQLKAIVGQGPLNQDAVIEIESLLLQADVGVEATDYIIETLQKRLRQEALPPEEAIAYLKTIIRELLDKPLEQSERPSLVPEKDTLNIWLITGVNGAGKTTTIGKLAHLANKSGYRCLIAAGDTFRAAAVEQVKIWGERSGTPVIANPGKNIDPAAIVFDSITAAQARNTELLLVDTAGRLQNKKNLMEELAKIRRIIDKQAPNAKVESLLVLDATLGQNGLRQAEIFSQAAKLSGVVLTKLDSTAKGGVALAVVQQLELPIRFVGAGEGLEDLRPFSSYEFVEALLNG